MNNEITTEMLAKAIDDTKKKVVKLHIQEGRTIASLAAEYGVCTNLKLHLVLPFRLNSSKFPKHCLRGLPLLSR